MCRFRMRRLCRSTFDAGTYTQGDITLPRVDAIAAKDATGKLWLEITNLDPNQSVEIEANLTGITAKSAAGRNPDCAEG